MLLLLVDDSEASLQVLKDVVEDRGHTVVGLARDGLEAVAKYQDLHPQAVFLDVIMPRMNGLDALAAIRQLDPQARVVMVSSMQSPETALAARQAGAMYFLNKPFDLPVVHKVLDLLAQAIAQQ